MEAQSRAQAQVEGQISLPSPPAASFRSLTINVVVLEQLFSFGFRTKKPNVPESRRKFKVSMMLFFFPSGLSLGAS